MIVCHCHRVSDRAVRGAVRDGAVSTAGVMAACQAGSDCGSCHAAVEQLIEREVAVLGLTVAVASPA